MSMPQKIHDTFVESLDTMSDVISGMKDDNFRILAKMLWIIARILVYSDQCRHIR